MIPLVDLTISSKTRAEIDKKIAKVIDSKIYILGPELAAFEKSFAKFNGSLNAIGVASGTDALRLSLRACGIGRGDHVLTVAFTSPFTVIAIIEEGAIPVFVDISERTLTMDVDDLRTKINSKTRAIVPVHLYGNPCNMKEIVKIAKKNKLVVIEDACQAHGAVYQNKRVGNFGRSGAFSFYPTKNLGGMGDGGAVVTNDAGIAKKIRMLRHGGQDKRFWHELAGINSRLDEIQASILSVKLKLLVAQNAKRIALAARYRKFLRDLPLEFQESHDGGKSVYHIFVIKTKSQKKLKDYLLTKGIFCDIYYPYSANEQPAFKKFTNAPLPVTKKLTSQILALPLFANLSFASQDTVIKNIRSFFNQHG